MIAKNHGPFAETDAADNNASNETSTGILISKLKAINELENVRITRRDDKRKCAVTAQVIAGLIEGNIVRRAKGLGSQLEPALFAEVEVGLYAHIEVEYYRIPEQTARHVAESAWSSLPECASFEVLRNHLGRGLTGRAVRDKIRYKVSTVEPLR
jgi:hypothetical protein